jgi:thiol-disulfide isomerase/thioredoxin
MPALKLLTAAAVLSLAGVAGAQTMDLYGLKILNPVRESSAARLDELTRRELKPFPAEAWSTLADWTNGAAISKSATDGKVVLIVTWADWYAPSVRGLNLARRMAEKYGKDGLVVVAVHADQGWTDAKKPKAPEGATFLLAHDAGDKFRKAVNVDADPDFYFIDRSGAMRFADVVNESVEDAVKGLLAETKEDAASLSDRIRNAKEKFEQERKRSVTVNNDANLATLPELPFEKPDAAAYSKAALPKMTEKANNPDDKPTTIDPKDIPLGSAKWSPFKPVTDGRAYVVYFWHPDLLLTYEKPMLELELLQKQWPRDLIVVGVLTSSEEFEQIKVAELKLRRLSPTEGEEVMKRFREKRSLQHYQILDLDGTLFKSVMDNNSNQENLDPGPRAVVVTSDGKARWWGGQWGTGFKAAIDKVLSADPGILARRKAEAEYISKQKSGAGSAAPVESSGSVK